MERITRRGSLKRLGALATGAFVAPMINRGRFELFAQSTKKYSARAIDLLRQSTVLDMLNPFSLIGVVAMFKGDKRTTWFLIPKPLAHKIFSVSKIHASMSCTSAWEPADRMRMSRR